MDEFEKSVIADFIGENWAQFCAYCDAMHGLDETEAEAIQQHLEELA